MARLAWRNNHRYIGRLSWNSLELLDARDATTPDSVFEACLRHLRHAMNSARIRSTISVFRPADGERKGIRIWNHQLIHYAGYQAADGSILGDPQQASCRLKRKRNSIDWASIERSLHPDHPLHPTPTAPYSSAFPGEFHPRHPI